MRNVLFVLLLAFGAVAFSARPADALPTFAKAYGVQCSTCHTAVPQLNAYGRYVQRTGYAALSRDLLKTHTPATFSESPAFDTSSGSGRVEVGNFAIHAAGYISPSITFHIHQFLVEDGNVGGIDVMQLAYNFKNDLHLFAGKMSAAAVPAPFSNSYELTPFASAELQVGEHMYQTDMMRWGSSLAYVRPQFYTQVSWLGSGEEWNGATDFSSSTDKTVEWIAAYADAGKPLEAGFFGSFGSFPLAEGGVDHYNTIAAYVQRDPGPKYVPGIFAVYQLGNDENPGSMDVGTSAALKGANFRPLRLLDEPDMSTSTSTHSRAYTIEGYEPLFNGSVLIGLRKEMTDDGLGTVMNSGAVDLAITPLSNYQYLHLYFEGATQPAKGPAWKGMAWWAVPIGER